MQIIDPSYEILACPEGEECLAFLERVCRLAYKSEERIDDGCEPCSACGGLGQFAKLRYSEMDDRVRGAEVVTCPRCKGRGKIQVREPSSHKLIRGILKSDRREKLKIRAREVFNSVGSTRTLMTIDNIVDMVLDAVRDDPPHESVIEHESITVKFVMDRGISHELVRHRLCAFTQESSRYCDYTKGKFDGGIAVVPPSAFEEVDNVMNAYAIWRHYVAKCEMGYQALRADGTSPQNARSILPTCTKTEIVVTANLREWRHIFKMRCSPKAHPDMRRLMIPLLAEMKTRIPIIYDDFPEYVMPEA